MHNGGSYSASKAAMAFLGETTAMEYNSKTLRIQTLIPLYVSTKMLNYASVRLCFFDSCRETRLLIR